jgi:large subunit ribosomal protein L25
MEKIELVAAKRTAVGKRARRLRVEGKIPAVMYGRGVKNEPLELEAKAVERMYRLAGGNKIVALKVGEGRAKNVLFHAVQRGASRDELTHIDFYVVRMDEVIRTAIPLRYTGESTAVYQQEGHLVQNLTTVEVEALPGDLPESIEVDISGLDDFEKAITLADLAIPAGVKLIEEDLGMLVAKVEQPRAEEELDELNEPIDEAAEMPEGVKEGTEAVSEENEGQADR